VTGETHRPSPPRVSPCTRLAAPTANHTAPTRSKRPRRTGVSGPIAKTVNTAVSTASGTLTKKIAAQPKYSVSTPPTTGPAAAPSPFTAKNTLIAVPRERPS
jgi:hypothetical protein